MSLTARTLMDRLRGVLQRYPELKMTAQLQGSDYIVIDTSKHSYSDFFYKRQDLFMRELDHLAYTSGYEVNRGIDTLSLSRRP